MSFPTMNMEECTGKEEEDFQELEHLSNPSSEEHEQQQRLLPGNQESWQKRAGNPRWTRFRKRATIFGYLLMAVGLIITIVSLLQHGAADLAEDAPLSSLIERPSYVLSQRWNFDEPPKRREFDWTVRDHVHNPDGIYRSMMLVNNMFPGPLIEANDGDTIVVRVDNQARNATSLHWHGLFQNGTPHMDGTVGITQCPIAPGKSFTYEFKVDKQHGTYWWHGHQGLQTSDGLHGPLIIHSRREHELQTLDYASDQVVLLSDHYHDLSGALMFQYLMPDAENAEPVPDNGLINGQGVRSCDAFPARKCDNTSAHVGLPAFELEQGQRHRLRLINVGAFAEFQFQIDEHQLAITEVDGTDVHPEYYHRLNINTAQRYSVIIDASVTGQERFWLRARMISHCFTDPGPTLELDTFGIVHYGQHAAPTLPTSRDWEEKLDLECKDLNTTELKPVEVVTPPAEPDAVFYLRTNFEIGAFRLSRGYFNSSSWRADPSAPSLHRFLAQGKHNIPATNRHSNRLGAYVDNKSFDIDRELVIRSTGVQTIDLLISNFDDGNHPLHLHGYKFFVLAQGHGAPPLTRIDAAIDRASLAPLYDNLNITNPLRRDTVSVEAFGWILLRVVADNPGVWAFHCHVSWHAEAGLLMQLLTRADALADLALPAQHLSMCADEGIEKGMAPPDSAFEQFA